MRLSMSALCRKVVGCVLATFAVVSCLPAAAVVVAIQLQQGRL